MSETKDIEFGKLSELYTALNKYHKSHVSKLIYSKSDVINAVSEAMGKHVDNIKKYVDKKYPSRQKFSDDHIDHIINKHVAHDMSNKQKKTLDSCVKNNQIGSGDEYLVEGIDNIIEEYSPSIKEYSPSIKEYSPSQSHSDSDINGKQEGGDKNTMNSIIKELETDQLYSDSDINGKPYGEQEGGGGKNVTHDVEILEIEKLRESKQNLDALGDGIVPITEENKQKLFKYLYYVYPELKKSSDVRLSNLFENTDKDGSIEWEKCYKTDLSKSIKKILSNSYEYFLMGRPTREDLIKFKKVLHL
jgi:hypothetical protein